MAKGGKGRHRVSPRQFRACPYPPRLSHSHGHGNNNNDIVEDFPAKQCPKSPERRDWEDATCCVCIEHPHNAVLLLCSSHDKGCRPYMCGTGHRHSNCLDQYRKAYTKVVSDPTSPELACPLCRGQVKGWTVVGPARDHLNSKERSCTHEGCSFVGDYKSLRRHVRADHPSRRPREVDPAAEQKWRTLERDRERDDVVSTIASAIPGAMFFGDYVIEGNSYAADSDDDDDGDDAGEPGAIGSNLVNVFLLLHAFGSSAGGIPPAAAPVGGVAELTDDDDDDDDDDDGGGDGDVGGGVSLASRLSRHGRVLLGRSGRRRRRRELNGDGAR